MKKRIVVSMLIIALAAAMLGGATFAWFTDSATVSTTFTVGSLDLDKPIAEVLNITDLAPGDTTDVWTVAVKNVGTMEMKYRMYFAGDEVNLLANKLEVIIDGVNVGTLASLIGEANALVFNSLLVDATDTYLFEFYLSDAAGNEYKEADFTGTLVVEATQVGNTGWGE